jgi:hypothetical protein
MEWDSEKACEVKSQDYTRKFLMLLLLKPSRCLARSQVGVWRLLRFCNEWTLKALTVS